MGFSQGKAALNLDPDKEEIENSLRAVRRIEDMRSCGSIGCSLNSIPTEAARALSGVA